MTALEQLLEDRLGESLAGYLERCKAFRFSVRQIARALELDTGVKVSKSSVAKWLNTEPIK